MVLLVAVGSLIGPSVMGLVENPLKGVGAQLIFTIGASLILFHGGTGISLRVISRTAFGEPVLGHLDRGSSRRRALVSRLHSQGRGMAGVAGPLARKIGLSEE